MGQCGGKLKDGAGRKQEGREELPRQGVAHTSRNISVTTVEDSSNQDPPSDPRDRPQWVPITGAGRTDTPRRAQPTQSRPVPASVQGHSGDVLFPPGTQSPSDAAPSSTTESVLSLPSSDSGANIILYVHPSTPAEGWSSPPSPSASQQQRLGPQQIFVPQQTLNSSRSSSSSRRQPGQPQARDSAHQSGQRPPRQLLIPPPPQPQARGSAHQSGQRPPRQLLIPPPPQPQARGSAHQSGQQPPRQLPIPPPPQPQARGSAHRSGQQPPRQLLIPPPPRSSASRTTGRSGPTHATGSAPNARATRHGPSPGRRRPGATTPPSDLNPPVQDTLNSLAQPWRQPHQSAGSSSRQE